MIQASQRAGKLHERMLAIVQPLLEKKEKGEHIPARELKNIKKLCELIEQMEKALHDEAKTAQALQAEKANPPCAEYTSGDAYDGRAEIARIERTRSSDKRKRVLAGRFG